MARILTVAVVVAALSDVLLALVNRFQEAGRHPFGASLVGLLGVFLLRLALPGPRRRFEVRRGRFVAPPSPAVRAVALVAVLVPVGMIPDALRHNRVAGIGLSDRGVIVMLVVLALALAFPAVCCWRYSVILDPAGVTVRAFAGVADRAAWERIRAGRVEGPAVLRGVEPEFIERAIRHYRDHPWHRAAIGTAAEHERLLAALEDPP